MSKSRSNTGGAKGPARSGRGITSNKLVRPAVRGGPPNTRAVSPAAVSKIGLAVGTHVMGNGGREVKRPNQPLVTGTPPQVPMGNQIALNVGKGGPGSGRVVHRSGSQSTHGPVNPGGPQPAPVDLLGQFGPESTKGR